MVRGQEYLVGVRLGGTGSRVGTGGMVTKVEAARIATGAGVTTLLTSASSITDALNGRDVGTVFLPTAPRPASRSC